jgi:uncharacterized LabA/DUF88 family protein
MMASNPATTTERVMIFIDGGFVRSVFKELFGSDAIDFQNLIQGLVRLYNAIPGYAFKANLIRAYYYDAIFPKTDPDYDAQEKYLNTVRRVFWCTVVLGELVRSTKKTKRQKGVDILLTIDALSKAYQDQYDTTVFLLGDRDFIPLVEAVKNHGKKVFGVYYGKLRSDGIFKTRISQELCKQYDLRIGLTEELFND